MWLLAPRPSTRSDLQNRIESGATQQDVVVLTLTLAHLDYAELKESNFLRASLETTLSKAIAVVTGKSCIAPESVALTFSVDARDTVRVQGIITPPAGSISANDLVSALRSSLTSKKGPWSDQIAKGLNSITGMEAVSKGAIQVPDVGAPQVVPIMYPEIKLDRKHGVPNGVFSLFESLHVLDDCRTFNAANRDELTTAEIVWALRKCSEVYKDPRLEKLFVWMVSGLQKKDRRSCNNWASTVAPNTLQFILAENPAKEEICGRSVGFPRDKLIAYAADCLVSVAIAIVAGDVLAHWTYDFNAGDQAFLGEAAEKLGTWSEASVPMAQSFWDRVSCRYILIEHAAKHGSTDSASAYLQRCPKDILCSRFKAPWRGPDMEASFFHLYPFLVQKDKDAAEHLIDCMAQADVYSSSDLSGALKAFTEDIEVSTHDKKDLLLSFVSACRRWEITPSPTSEGPGPRKCSIFKKPVAKEQEVSTSPRSTKDLELIALDWILKDYRSLKTAALKGAGDAGAESDLAEMLEAVLLLSTGDALWLWAKKKINEDSQTAADAKSFLKTVAMKHIVGVLTTSAGGDRKVKYDDNRARDLIEGTRVWAQEGGPSFGSTPKNKGRKAEDLGQVLRMYLKLDLALDGGSVLNFLRALDQGSDCMGAVFTKIAPKGSRLRLAIAEDVRRSQGPKGLLKDDEIDPLLSYAGFFETLFQNFVRSEEAMEDTRSWFESDGQGSKPKGMGLVPLLEATAKLSTCGAGCQDPTPEDAVLDVCEQCVSNPVTWRLFAKVVDAVRKGKFTHDTDVYDLGQFTECGKEMSKTGRLLQYKLQSGVSKTLQTDIEKVIDTFLEKTQPKAWISSIRSLDTVIFLLEYMGKEDLKLAFERFEHECKSSQHNELTDLVACVKKIYTQPLATTQDMDIGAAIQKKASLLKSPANWRGITFDPSDWHKILEIAGAAAETMKQRYSVIMLPHHTQMISLLMFAIRACGTRQETDRELPKTMLARVGTGEGKSLIIGMLAAFVAKKGMRAHVVNNNRVLTQRDYRGNSNIFTMLGIQASANPQDLKNKECLVVYCTGDDVESSCLDSLMDGGADEYEHGLEDAVLIVDEVDGLIFDRGTTSSKWFGDREFSDWVNEWLSQLMMHGKIQRDWDDFRSVDEWTHALQKEVEEAFHDSENKQEGVDYTRRGDRMYLLDAKTKMIREQDWSLWLEILKSQRNHPAQWIEYKYEKAILSSLQCFMSYSCIFGLTGSLGRTAEKKYLGEHYEATSFNVPYFLDTCRTDGKEIQGKKVPVHINKMDPLPTQAAQDRAVIELAVAKCTEVPVLVITKDSEAVRSLAQQLRDRLVQLYGLPPVTNEGGEEGADGRETVIELLHNPRNPKEFVELVDRATEPVEKGHGEEGGGSATRQVWRITVTTAEGGRGHDYRVVDPAIDEKGGLLLILTFVPWSEREWIQFVGRTGRQDHAGQYAVFLGAQDEQVQAAQTDKGPQETLIEAVLRHGDEQTAKMLQGTSEEIVKGRLMHTFTMRYWALHKQDKTSARQNWEWKKLLKEYAKVSTKEIQDRFYTIFPHEKRVMATKKAGGNKPAITSLSSKKEDLLQSTDGQRYKGDLVNGKPHGYGVFKTADGARYEGQWDQGQRSGKGKYVDGSGATYEGQWKEHDKSGKGVESYPDKARYEGDFLKGCKHGVGKYTTSTGATYEGQFVKDKYDGEGTYDFTSGRKYIGQWKRGQMEGHGKMVWANGVSYEGSYEQDVRHGEGIVKWPDGRVYQGHWHKGRLVGSGVMLEKDGNQKLML